MIKCFFFWLYVGVFYMGSLSGLVWLSHYCSSAARKNPHMHFLTIMCPGFLCVTCSSSGRTGQFWLSKRGRGGREWMGDCGQGRTVGLNKSFFLIFLKQRAAKCTIILILTGEVNGNFAIFFLRTSFFSFLCACQTIFSLRQIYPQFQVWIYNSYNAKHFKISEFVVIKVLSRYWKFELLCWRYSSSFIIPWMGCIFLCLTVVTKSSSGHLNITGEKTSKPFTS